MTRRKEKPCAACKHRLDGSWCGHKDSKRASGALRTCLTARGITESCGPFGDNWEAKEEANGNDQ
jgi:hypothetical protein